MCVKRAAPHVTGSPVEILGSGTRTPFNVEAMWHDGQFTYRLPLRLGKGRIPSPPRSMEQHPSVVVISK